MTDYQNVTKGDLLYTGKAKQMFATNNPEILWVEYMDQATALNGKRKLAIAEKGLLNNRIASLIFMDLKAHGIQNHFLTQLDERTQLVQKVTIIPLETVIRNAASGSFERKFGVPHLMRFSEPVVEFFYKSDELDDPFINESQIHALKVATASQIATMKTLALQVNQRLQKVFKDTGIDLVDFKIEFGITSAGKVLLADEISPDSCRLVDQKTGMSLDKDVFRKQTGKLAPVYEEVLRRLSLVEEA